MGFCTPRRAPKETQTVPVEPNWQAFQGKRVLVVEDDELNMEIAKTILEMKGCVVDMAANGREGIDDDLTKPIAIPMNSLPS